MGTLDRSARFWDRIANRYASKPVADEASYQKKLTITRHYLRPEMAVLELGCGTGSTAIAHAPYVRHIRAVDISEKMIEIARSKAEAANVTNITFEQATIESLSVPESSVDVVLALSILHLVEDRRGVLSQVYDLLKPGGYFVSSTTCLGDTMKYFSLVAPLGQRLGFLPVLKVFTATELEDEICAGGFHVEYRFQPARNKALFLVAKKPG